MPSAIRFMVKTHEVYQKQKRKGKDVTYISHPLTVGLILARAGAPGDGIIAGILHTTIEDSGRGKKGTREKREEGCGEAGADPGDRRGVGVRLHRKGILRSDVATETRFAEAKASLPPLTKQETKDLAELLRKWLMAYGEA